MSALPERRALVPPRRLLRQRPALASHHDRWIISYADFITLLFAFFVTMYATSNVDLVKLNSVVQSMQKAFVVTAPAEPHEARSGLLPGGDRLADSPPTDQVDLQRQLRERLSKDIKEGRVSLDVDTRGVVISMLESGSFPVGSTDLTPDAREILLRIASTIGDLKGTVRVEGHTDDVPIRTARFASNWDLSTARAVAVLQFLVGSGGIDAARLSASGYGQFRPRVANDSSANRARNRRVDLVVLNPATSASEEPARASLHAGDAP